jgi:hypothetical protein
VGAYAIVQTNSDGSWSWKPLLFDNPVEKVETMLNFMTKNGIIPECEYGPCRMPATVTVRPTLLLLVCAQVL